MQTSIQTSGQKPVQTSGPSNRAPFERVSLPHRDGAFAGWLSPDLPRANGARVKTFVIFTHATGLCAAAYRKGLSRVAPWASVLAVDMRGHGRTSLPADITPSRPLKDWQIYADDLRFIIQSIQARTPGETRFVLAGHSFGAVTALLAAAELARSNGGLAQSNTDDTERPFISALCLLEPVAMPQLVNRLAGTPAWGVFRKRFSMVVNAAKRRDRWDSAQHVRASYREKRFFAAWDETCLDDYLLDGLTQDENSVRLSCHPAWEAATFGAQANRFWPAIKQLAPKIRVVRGVLSGSTVPKSAATRLRRLGVELTDVKSAGHMFPLTDPDQVGLPINEILNKLERNGG